MDIANQETILRALQEQMNVLSNYKMERTRELMEKQRDNDLLEKVVDQYNAYDSEMRKLKLQQGQQMEYLLLYLEKAMAEAGITETMLDRAKHEKASLIKQIKKIQSDLEEVM